MCSPLRGPYYKVSLFTSARLSRNDQRSFLVLAFLFKAQIVGLTLLYSMLTDQII